VKNLDYFRVLSFVLERCTRKYLRNIWYGVRKELHGTIVLVYEESVGECEDEEKIY